MSYHTTNDYDLNRTPIQNQTNPITMPQKESYLPPAGPPPSQSQYAPPPFPPPSHDWQIAVPDTSLLPPPPTLGNQRSRTNNATASEAEQGEAWCESNPLTAPTALPADALSYLENGSISAVRPQPYIGRLDRLRPGVWAGKTKASSPDSCITGSLPLYSAMAHSPLRTGKPKTIYYEVRIADRNRAEVSLALGFAAPPYPVFRLPGWHRGCLAIHGDDGCRYVNDRWGGRDFTAPFKPGETLGIGMRFVKREVAAPPGYEGTPRTAATTPIDVEIFFTRDGRWAGGWNLHEEGDAEEDLPVTGLEGWNDLYAAVGTFEDVGFEIVFNHKKWLYRP